MLKTMENLVDRHIRDEILEIHPLHRYQFAYQPEKSTETALHHVITHIEEAVDNREVTLGAFLDIEGAFESTSFDITKAAKWLCPWTGSMQENHSHTCRRNSEGVCGQGLSARGHSIASAVEPGCGRTRRRTRWEWVLYTGICR
jgi:hypothetical protein